jgi:hypothetical protein
MESNTAPVTLDSDLDRQVQAFAEAEQIGFDEALAALVRIGLQVARGEARGREDRLRAVEERVQELGEMLGLVGPPVLGMRRLLAHWAAQSGSVQVTEDELVAEMTVVAGDEWEAALASRRVVPPLPPVEPGETGETD